MSRCQATLDGMQCLVDNEWSYLPHPHYCVEGKTQHIWFGKSGMTREIKDGDIYVTLPFTTEPEG